MTFLAEILALRRQLEVSEQLVQRYRHERDEARALARLAVDPNLDAAERAIHVEGPMEDWPEPSPERLSRFWAKAREARDALAITRSARRQP